MNFEDINFPVYRKYKNNRSYFKIINPLRMEEIQVVGSQKIIHQLEAVQYPEKLFISDLVTTDLLAVPITEEEYLAFKK